MKENSSLINEFEHNGHFYRTFGHGSYLGMIGCGFLKKQGPVVNFVQSHGHYAAVYVLSGKGTYVDEHGQEYALKPGMVFQRFTDRPHKLYIDESEPWYECFIALKYSRVEDPCFHKHFSNWVANSWIREIDLLEDSTSEVMGFLNMASPEAPVASPGIKMHLLKKMEKIYLEIKSASLTKVQQLHFQLLDILNELFLSGRTDSENSRGEDMIEQACEIIQNNISSRTPLPELLSVLSISYSTLRKLFRKNMGVSIGNYLIYLRIDRAGELLREGKSVKEVADLLGYDHHSALSTQFKKVTGFSPTDLKNRK